MNSENEGCSISNDIGRIMEIDIMSSYCPAMAFQQQGEGLDRDCVTVMMKMGDEYHQALLSLQRLDHPCLHEPTTLLSVSFQEPLGMDKVCTNSRCNGRCSDDSE